MEGWTEKEFENKDLMAPCGLYCGTCGVYIATRGANEKFRSAMANLYGTKPEETECLGCMQPDSAKKIYLACSVCTIRRCVKTKGYYSCHQCEDWPCSMTKEFLFATGVRVMERTIPIWRAKVAEHGHRKGSVEWARAECERYHCSSCGKPLFRGAQRCRACRKQAAEESLGHDGTPLDAVDNTKPDLSLHAKGNSLKLYRAGHVRVHQVSIFASRRSKLLNAGLDQNRHWPAPDQLRYKTRPRSGDCAEIAPSGQDSWQQ